MATAVARVGRLERLAAFRRWRKLRRARRARRARTTQLAHLSDAVRASIALGRWLLRCAAAEHHGAIVAVGRRQRQCKLLRRWRRAHALASIQNAALDRAMRTRARGCCSRALATWRRRLLRTRRARREVGRADAGNARRLQLRVWRGWMRAVRVTRAQATRTSQAGWIVIADALLVYNQLP